MTQTYLKAKEENREAELTVEWRPASKSKFMCFNIQSIH